MREIVFARGGWIPKVVRDDGALRIELGAGADALHDPRTFSFPIETRHLDVIRDDLTRHLLLWAAILPLCVAAGIRGPLDERAAVALLDPILLSEPAEVDELFRRIRHDARQLIAQGADIDLLERGELVAAMRSATPASDWQRVREHDADRRRAERSVVLAPLDEAILRFTGQLVSGSLRLRRHPEDVDPPLLPDVMRVIATGERACAGMRIGRDPRRGRHGVDKRAWRRVEDTVDADVRHAHPGLVDDAVRAVSSLMCSEAFEEGEA